jgi:hypothetical protein
MAIVKRKHPSPFNSDLVWYSTEAKYWNYEKEPVQHAENQELLKRSNAARNEAEDNFNAKYSPEEQRAMVKEGERKEAAEQAKYEQNKITSKFVRDNSSWYTNDLHNRDLLIARLDASLQASGRVKPGETIPWTEQDFKQALDSLADEGLLHCHAPYQRQGPDTNAMTTDELRQLAIDQLGEAGLPRQR